MLRSFERLTTSAPSLSCSVPTVPLPSWTVVWVEVPKLAVPAGTVLGTQFALSAKLPLGGAADQVAS